MSDNKTNTSDFSQEQFEKELSDHIKEYGSDKLEEFMVKQVQKKFSSIPGWGEIQTESFWVMSDDFVNMPEINKVTVVNEKSSFSKWIEQPDQIKNTYENFTDGIAIIKGTKETLSAVKEIIENMDNATPDIRITASIALKLFGAVEEYSSAIPYIDDAVSTAFGFGKISLKNGVDVFTEYANRNYKLQNFKEIIDSDTRGELEGWIKQYNKVYNPKGIDCLNVERGIMERYISDDASLLTVADMAFLMRMFPSKHFGTQRQVNDFLLDYEQYTLAATQAYEFQKWANLQAELYLIELQEQNKLTDITLGEGYEEDENTSALTYTSISQELKIEKISVSSNQMQLASTAAPVYDPLILDLNQDKKFSTSVEDGAHFDFAGDGFAEKTAWVSSTDGILVRDKNGNGTIDDGNELFGDRTILSSGKIAKNGFEALSDLDSNKDGVINAEDSAFGELKVWIDGNSDGITQSDELKILTDAGVSEIALSAENVNARDENGNVWCHYPSNIDVNIVWLITPKR